MLAIPPVLILVMGDVGVTVEAYAGYRYGERPRAFTWRGQRHIVLAVQRRWRSPRGLGFIVTAEREGEEVSVLGRSPEASAGDGDPPRQRWELTYDEVRDTWHIRSAEVDGDGAS